MNRQRVSQELRLYYRAKEVAALTGLGLRTIYGGIAGGWIPSRKIGNARLVPAAWLNASTDNEADYIADAIAQNIDTLWAMARAWPRAIARAASAFLREFALSAICYS